MSAPADAVAMVASPVPPPPASPAPPAGSLLARHKSSIDQISEISRNSQTTFLALMGACVYSFLTIASTTDTALLSNSEAAPLPIIQVAVPTGGFFVVGPLLLVALFLYLHLYLEGYWRAIAKLPLKHPDDGRALDDYIYPWLISCAFIRGEVHRQDAPGRASARAEAGLSLFLGWGLVPMLVFFYWARFLVVHDWRISLFHIALFWASLHAALHFAFTSKNALRRSDADGPDAAAATPGLALSRRQARTRRWVPVLAMLALLYLTWVAFTRLASPACDAHDAPWACLADRPGRALWGLAGFKPVAEVVEARFVPRPADWRQVVEDAIRLRAYLEGQRTLNFTARDLSGIAAKAAFLPGSAMVDTRLDHADLEGASLALSNLRRVNFDGSILKGAGFQGASIHSSSFRGVQAGFAVFDKAQFTDRVDQASELSGDFTVAHFIGAVAEGVRVGRAEEQGATSFIEANLTAGNFKAARFENVDMSVATLDHADFTKGTFWKVDFTRSKLLMTFMNRATFVACAFQDLQALRDSAFDDAIFVDTTFDSNRHPDLSGFKAPGARFQAGTRFLNLRIVGADLRAATFMGTELSGVRFADADLSDAVFQDVDLGGVEFEAKVNLSGADLRGARGVRPELLKGACGNSATRLPAHPAGLVLKDCQ